MKAFRRLYRLVLCLWPAAFRARFGGPALRMAHARVREEAGARRAVRAVRELADVIVTAPRLRREARNNSTRRRSLMFEGLVSDLRHGARSLLRTRGFLGVTLGTLTVGVALCVCVMVVVNAYLLRGLPYPDSDRLFWVRYGNPAGPLVEGLEKLDWRALDDVVEQPISWDLDLFNLRGAPYAEAAQGTWVTSGYMEGFGIRPAIGRTFHAQEYQTGGPSVALISHRLWRTRFGGDPAIAGRTFEAYVNDRPGEPQTFTIVGVLPDRMWHLNVFTEILAPLRAPSFPYMTRLRPGVTEETAVRRIEALVRASGLAIPDGWRVRLESAHDAYVLQIRPLLMALATATGLVMLIACANVAVLFTVRAAHRQREIAVRKALGASRGRIIRALGSEALVLGAAATMLGIGLAQVVIASTAPLLERHLGRSAPGGVNAIGIDGVTFSAALAAGALVTALCALAQLWASTRSPVALALGGQKGSSAGPHQRRAHGALIAVEVAASLTLLVGAALTVQSGMRILGVDMGLDTRNVLVGRITLSQTTYPDPASRTALYERVTAGGGAIEGVRAIAFANSWPLQAMPWRGVGHEGTPLTSRAGVMAVSPGYFDTLHISIEDGRAFDAQDRQGADAVVIVSRALASRMWPDRRAVGQRLKIGPVMNADPNAAGTALLVVGVSGNVRHAHTDDDLADAYVPLLQSGSASAFMYARTDGPRPRVESQLRDTIARIDPDIALAMPRPLADLLDAQRAGSRFLASLLVVFSVFAAALALVGIYGVITYTVRQREREIAVRLAIGADRRMITSLFLRQGATVLAIGLALGLVGAVLLGRVLETQLFGVEPAEPVALVVTTLAFAACGLVAVTWPARAAASTDPAMALKE